MSPEYLRRQALQYEAKEIKSSSGASPMSVISSENPSVRQRGTGNDAPTWALRMRIREVMFCSVSGSGPSAVFSRCRAVSAVKSLNVSGNGPATGCRCRQATHRIAGRGAPNVRGELPPPTISRFSSTVRLVNSAGRDAGIARKVSCPRAPEESVAS
jgi:hypothetical protein